MDVRRVAVAILVAVGLPGCETAVVPEDTQAILVLTSSRDSAQCNLSNGRGAWSIAATPANITVARAATALAINCRTTDGQTGAVNVDAKALAVAQPSGPIAWLTGAEEAQSAAAFEYPAVVVVPMGQPTGLSAGQPNGGAANDRKRAEDANIILRFQTLRQLLVENLITRDEYNLRRGANLGALLPYSLQPPARDLGRAAPSGAQVVSRLKYLAAAYAEHTMTADEQSAERAVILEALLPAAPLRRADPPPPLNDEMQLAAAIGRLARLRDNDVISEEERAREKATVVRLLEANMAASEAAARVAAGLAATAQIQPTGIGVRLASYRTQAQAERAWAGLQKAHPAELGDLRPVIASVAQRNRPPLYRLSAGPVADRAAATLLCRTLRHRGQPCEPTNLGE